MVQIDYTAQGFAASWGPRLSGGGILSVPFIDVLAAALTVGRPSWSAVLRYGVYSRAELVYRLFQVVAYLVPIGGRLSRSPAYDGLDPSEKSAVSYYCGLTLAKLVADEFFAVPYLQHIACYPPPSLQYLTGLRPDLAGMDTSGRWYVVEAKGRSNEAKASVLSQAKAQTRAVGKVAGAPPYLRLAVVADFPRGVLRVQLEDPEDPEDTPGDWNISASQTLQLHYAPWLAIVSTFEHEQLTVGQREFAVVYLTEVDLAIGLDVRLVRLLPAFRDSTERDNLVKELLGLLPREVVHLPVVEVRPIGPWAGRIGRDALFLGVGRSWEMDRGA